MSYDKALYKSTDTIVTTESVSTESEHCGPPTRNGGPTAADRSSDICAVVERAWCGHCCRTSPRVGSGVYVALASVNEATIDRFHRDVRRDRNDVAACRSPIARRPRDLLRRPPVRPSSATRRLVPINKRLSWTVYLVVSPRSCRSSSRTETDPARLVVRYVPFFLERRIVKSHHCSAFGMNVTEVNPPSLRNPAYRRIKARL